MIVLRVYAGFTLPTVGYKGAADGGRVVEAGDVVTLRMKLGCCRFEVVTKKDRACFGRVGFKHGPGFSRYRNGLDLAAGGEDKVTAGGAGGGGFPPAGAELVALRAGVIHE